MAKKGKTTKKQAQATAAARGQMVKVRGQGDYYTDRIKPFLRENLPAGTFAEYGDKIGAMLGNRVDPSVAGFAGKTGRKLGGWLSRVVGFGDYTVKDNSLLLKGGAVPAGELIPDFGVFGNAVRVKHREYISDVFVPATPTAFTNVTYVINPGNSTVFPWLATIAAGFSQYTINGMLFEFKSMTSPVNTGGPLGTVVMATNYDIIEPAYTDKIRMENAQYSCSAAPSVHQMHTVECLPSETTNRIKYVRNPLSGTSASQDARWMDHGLFQLATTGLAGSAGQVLGELWVSYDITFLKPVASELVGFEGQKIVGTVNVLNTKPFGDAPVITGTTYATITSATPPTITFSQMGTYELSLLITGTTTNVIVSGTAARSALAGFASAAGTGYLNVDRISVTAVGQTYVPSTNTSAAVSASILIITPCSFTI